MNTNSNLYTVIYATLVVILVAAILSLASMLLKPMQEANEKAETISQMLTSAKFYQKEELGQMGNQDILNEYTKVISEAILVNGNGEKVGELDTKNSEIYTESNLKSQNDIMKKGGSDLKLPVFIFNKDGKKITVIPCYGAGLWGPIWGYLALDEDLETYIGVYFDHASETPGLGAKIKDDPEFQQEFVNKKIDLNDKFIFNIKKNATESGKDNAVDAITGATMTSQGLDVAMNMWLKAYKPYLAKQQELYKAKLAANTENVENAESIENKEDK